jgi:hypothetical protein
MEEPELKQHSSSNFMCETGIKIILIYFLEPKEVLHQNKEQPNITKCLH